MAQQIPLFGVEIASLGPVATAAPGGNLEQDPYPSLLDAYQASGASWCRVRLSWSAIEAQEDVYNWNYYDQKLAHLAGAGAHLIITVADNPSWAASTACGPINRVPLSAFSEFLTLLVNRFKDPPYNIHHWELYNEPDGVWTSGQAGGLGCWGYHGEEYAEMLAVAYPAIKAADPQAQVLFGGIAYDWFVEQGGPFYRYFIDDVLQAGGGDDFDLMSFHYFPEFHTEWDAKYNYKYGRDLVAKSNYIRARMGLYGVEKPLAVTELAERGYNRPKQARYVLTGFTRAVATDLQITAWYGLVTYDYYQMGLLDEDLVPKPAFTAYQTAVRELTGLEYAHDMEGVDFFTEGYVFTQPAYLDKERTVIWTLNNDYGQQTTERVAFAGRQLRLVDRDGTVWYLDDGGEGDLDGVINGEVAITATLEPLVVDPDPLYGIMEADRDMVEVGGALTYTLRIVNGTESTLTVRLEDPVPAPTWVTVLSDTVVGGMLVTGTQPLVYWEGVLPPQGGTHTLSFQVGVLDYPPGWQIENRATLTQLEGPNPPLPLELSHLARVWGKVRQYLPMVQKQTAH